jgi:lysophospholipase L1-like esterase
MHPTAEGHAAMADAILMDLRPAIRALLDGQ